MSYVLFKGKENVWKSFIRNKQELKVTYRTDLSNMLDNAYPLVEFYIGKHSTTLEKLRTLGVKANHIEMYKIANKETDKLEEKTLADLYKMVLCLEDIMGKDTRIVRMDSDITNQVTYRPMLRLFLYEIGTCTDLEPQLEPDTLSTYLYIGEELNTFIKGLIQGECYETIYICLESIDEVIEYLNHIDRERISYRVTEIG